MCFLPFLEFILFSRILPPYIEKESDKADSYTFHKMNPLIVRLLAQVGTFRHAGLP